MCLNFPLFNYIKLCPMIAHKINIISKLFVENLLNWGIINIKGERIVLLLSLLALATLNKVDDHLWDKRIDHNLKAMNYKTPFWATSVEENRKVNPYYGMTGKEIKELIERESHKK